MGQSYAVWHDYKISQLVLNIKRLTEQFSYIKQYVNLRIMPHSTILKIFKYYQMLICKY